MNSEAALLKLHPLTACATNSGLLPKRTYIGGPWTEERLEPASAGTREHLRSAMLHLAQTDPSSTPPPGTSLGRLQSNTKQS